jgi:hypothetical protein
MAENKIFTDEEILKALKNIQEIVESQKELNKIIDKRLQALEKFTLLTHKANSVERK